MITLTTVFYKCSLFNTKDVIYLVENPTNRLDCIDECYYLHLMDPKWKLIHKINSPILVVSEDYIGYGHIHKFLQEIVIFGGKLHFLISYYLHY